MIYEFVTIDHNGTTSGHRCTPEDMAYLAIRFRPRDIWVRTAECWRLAFSRA